MAEPLLRNASSPHDVDNDQRLTFHRVDGRTVVKLIGLDVDLPVVAMVAMVGEVCIAAWGLAWKDRACWLWFAIEGSKPAYRFIVMREAKKMLKRAAQLGETEVFVVRDDAYPTSARLLKILGFEPSRIEDGKEIWRWHF